MEVTQHKMLALFRKTHLSKAIHLLIFATLSSHAFADGAPPLTPKWSITENYLDANVSEKIVDANACFSASPKSLLEVEPIISEGKRAYKISNYFDHDIQKSLYAKPLDQQVQEHKIVGRSFCKGMVSISDMDLPFAKSDGINDANDGLLMLDTLRAKMMDIANRLDDMSQLAVQAASGTYSSYQLSNMDHEFQAQLAQINVISASARFNGIQLLDGSHDNIQVPVHHGADTIPVHLPDFTSGSMGLNISWLAIDSNQTAQTALAVLNNATTYLDINHLKPDEINLLTAATLDAVTTWVDVTKEPFVVQKKSLPHKLPGVI